jgi:hypothetical protein
MKQDRFFHIRRCLHSCDNRNEPDKIDENYDRMWKMRTIFDKLTDAYAKYYSPTEHLSVHEINVLSFSNSIHQRNTNSLGQKSTSHVAIRDIHETCQCIKAETGKCDCYNNLSSHYCVRT